MRNASARVLSILALAVATPAQAGDFSLQAFADVRLVFPDGESSWLDGGLGKFRYGDANPNPDLRFAQAIAQGTWAVTPALHAVASVRGEPLQRSGIDVLEAYAAYRPASDGDWQWWAKAGAFFPPFALENTDLGWSSPYTITPSAIDSWIGDELRTIGTEASLVRRTNVGTFSFTGSLFCCNDPAGVLIAYRGWSFDDRPSGLFETLRYPDATLTLFGEVPPQRTPLFREVDSRIGWYAGAGWTIATAGKLSIYRYDNEADDAAVSGAAQAWRTAFWSAGWELHEGAFAVLAQAMTGQTSISPSPGFRARTDFRSAYVLVAYDVNSDWRIAARTETFNTFARIGSPLNESGNAVTASASWMPNDWLQATVEWIAVQNSRGERILEGTVPNRPTSQLQCNLRFFL